MRCGGTESSKQAWMIAALDRIMAAAAHSVDTEPS